MNRKQDPFFRILCITKVPEAFAGALAIMWSRSGIVRWHFAGHNEVEWKNMLANASLVLLDCSSDQVGDASKVQTEIPSEKCWPVDFSGKARIPWAPGKKPLDAKKLSNALRSIALPVKSAPINWPKLDPDMHLVKPVLDPILPLVLQKYFPTRQSTAHVHKVVDGWSGTPLIRISIDGEHSEYFLKFFDSYDEFILEWDSHRRAVEWFGPFAVPLQPLEEVPLSGVEQAAAFPRDSSLPPESNHLYPICYHSAPVTVTLRELYRERDDNFVADAYNEVLTVFKLRQSHLPVRHRALADLEDFGPGRKRRTAGQTMMDSLRSFEYQSFIRRAEVDLKPYAEHCLGGTDWITSSSALHAFLESDAPWITEQVDITSGCVHGDANARNFLFHGAAPKPRDLRIIDCGGCQEDGPLVFDLAQMESDLKIVLLATETSSPDYKDIDSPQLQAWIKQEKEALSTFVDIKRLPETPDSTWRAYRVVRMIRERAAEISPNDPDGRNYFFHLLYWTLRKLRHTNFPHVKRLLAFYSASQICLNMSRWKRP